ncbi:MAG: fasciclin domain-containing protein [Paludibacter sp.]|nr:fasciclin domain-containing protein [Paludibacter sp.]
MKKWTPILVFFLLLLTSCVSELDKYYATPDWLKGNAWEVLEKKGNFKLFLSAVERTSYKDLVQGKGIITVMAPTDSAFQVYLTKHNYASVAAIPDSVVTKLVGFHLLFYAFDKDKFVDYKPNGIESTNELKGMYYKFRTKSRDDISVEHDPAFGNAARKVMHKDRFLPVFSFNLFDSYGLNAKANYEFFYPNSTWTGQTGFNVSNASVKEYGIVTDNGYVYTVNQVIEPLGTIYNELKAETNYTIFKNAYDRFVTFEYDATSTADYGKGDSLFIMYHGSQLPPIASEWPVFSYTQLDILSYGAYSLFAPSNTAMQSFYDQYWRPYYNNKGIDSVKFEPLLTLLQNHIYSGTVLFPEQIESGKIKSPYGSTIQFNRTSAQMKHICVNGALYGLDHVIVPPMFEKVTSPMYCNPQYNMILDMMKNSSYVQTLITDAAKFNVFYPTDNMILTYTNFEGKSMYYSNKNDKRYGSQDLQIDGDDGFQKSMTVNQKKTFAGGHIGTEIISTKSATEYVYRTLQPYNYLYVNGSKIYSSSLYNLGVDAKVPTFTKIDGGWTNGNAYALSGATASALVPEANQFKNLTATSSPADLKNMIAYLTAAGITSSSPPYNFLQGERFIVLVPPAASLLAGYNALPTKTPDKVAAFLKPYFINVGSSNLLDYPFPGAGVQGTLVSFGKKADGSAATFTLVDRGNELVIIDAKGNEAKVTSYFPKIYADGAAYLIDKLLVVE